MHDRPIRYSQIRSVGFLVTDRGRQFTPRNSAAAIGLLRRGRPAARCGRLRAVTAEASPHGIFMPPTGRRDGCAVPGWGSGLGSRAPTVTVEVSEH